MNQFRSTAFGLLLTSGLATLPLSASATQDNVSGDPQYTVEYPKAFSMTADLLIARPLQVAATAVGAGVFVVTLPFSALGGNVGEAAEALVIEPGRAAFARCLGCTETLPPHGQGYPQQ